MSPALEQACRNVWREAASDLQHPKTLGSLRKAYKEMEEGIPPLEPQFRGR